MFRASVLLPARRRRHFPGQTPTRRSTITFLSPLVSSVLLCQHRYHTSQHIFTVSSFPQANRAFTGAKPGRDASWPHISECLKDMPAHDTCPLHILVTEGNTVTHRLTQASHASTSSSLPLPLLLLSFSLLLSVKHAMPHMALYTYIYTY